MRQGSFCARAEPLPRVARKVHVNGRLRASAQQGSSVEPMVSLTTMLCVADALLHAASVLVVVCSIAITASQWTEAEGGGVTLPMANVRTAVVRGEVSSRWLEAGPCVRAPLG
jgi:hypothetical protein